MSTILFDPSTPNLLRKELAKIVELTQRRAQITLPEIVVVMDCSYAKSPRNFAAIGAGAPSCLHICPDLAVQPVTRIRGVLIHEMGHLLQWIFRRHRKELIPKELKLDHEQEADYLLQALCDLRLYYDRDMVQSTKPSSHSTWPRPKGLR